MAPGCVQTHAASEDARRWHSASGFPRSSPVSRAAVNESPAPMVSRTEMGGAGRSERWSREKRVLPADPRVRAMSSRWYFSRSECAMMASDPEQPAAAAITGSSSSFTLRRELCSREVRMISSE